MFTKLERLISGAGPELHLPKGLTENSIGSSPVAAESAVGYFSYIRRTFKNLIGYDPPENFR
tara:strand:- start:972 stop:1157 length:186 start_codon:yes stop_codon:yes gene_type:complete